MFRTPRKQVDFSVIIPTYNRSKLLKLSLASVLRQKNVSFEIIVSDDCSTDDTEGVVRALRDKRITYIKNKERLGTSMNFQKSFLRARGNYLFTLGDDDLILDDNTLSDILIVMRKYHVGMGKIGTITYEKSLDNPYQVSILSDALIVLKPEITKDILTKSIDYGLGFYSGLVFDNFRLDRKQLAMDHACYPDHMCHVYHPAAYDLIQKYGIAYVPKHFIIARLSLQLIPRYFDMAWHGRLFMEEPILLARKFLSAAEYETYKQTFLRAQLVLLANIKFYSTTRNYIYVLRRMIALDKTLLGDPRFIMWCTVGFMPKPLIKILRRVMVLATQERVKKIVAKYGYFPKIAKLQHSCHPLPCRKAAITL